MSGIVAPAYPGEVECATSKVGVATLVLVVIITAVLVAVGIFVIIILNSVNSLIKDVDELIAKFNN